MKPEIHKLMVLSTAHITKACNDALGMLDREDGPGPGPGCYLDHYLYGFHLTLSAEPDEAEWIDPSLEEVVAYARKHGCTHLRLDRDGPTMNDLPQYEW